MVASLGTRCLLNSMRGCGSGVAAVVPSPGVEETVAGGDVGLMGGADSDVGEGLMDEANGST